MATTIEYQVTGMSCGHCETALRIEVSEIPGVTDVHVSAQGGGPRTQTKAALDPYP